MLDNYYSISVAKILVKYNLPKKALMLGHPKLYAHFTINIVPKFDGNKAKMNYNIVI